MATGPNYDTDVIKHYVRCNGWVKPFAEIHKKVERDFSNKKRKERCKYLTFCAKNAIDVFLLEKENILYRDPETRRLVNVYFCEERDEDFTLIQNLIGGSETPGFYGNFADLIFQNYDEIHVPQDDDGGEMQEIEDVESRRIIRLKKSQENLFQTFPFDIINFDIYGNLFPESKNRYSEQCKMFAKLLELQKNEKEGYGISKFLLYLTVFTPVDEKQINKATTTEFKGILYNNQKYDFFQPKIAENYGVEKVDDLNFHILYTLGFLKLVIMREGYRHGWNVSVKDLYCYDRKFEKNDEPYKMSCYILELIRNDQLDDKQDFQGSVPEIIEQDYQEQLKNFLDHLPVDVPPANRIDEEIKNNLQEVVKFRDDFLRSIENIA